MLHTLPPLPYGIDALEPVIDARTMALHHDKHHGAYVTALNTALEAAPLALRDKSAEWLLCNLSKVPEAIRTEIRHQAGGHLNHSLFWTSMSASGGGSPVGSIFIDEPSLPGEWAHGFYSVEWGKSEVALHPLVLLPPREWLYARCDARFDSMMTGGAIEEVEALLARSLPADAPVMRAIGVPEISAMLSGQITRNDAIALGKIATRQYAKRQFTWFRNQSPGHWARWEQEINNSNTKKIEIIFQSL